MVGYPVILRRESSSLRVGSCFVNDIATLWQRIRPPYCPDHCEPSHFAGSHVAHMPCAAPCSITCLRQIPFLYPDLAVCAGTSSSRIEWTEHRNQPPPPTEIDRLKSALAFLGPQEHGSFFCAVGLVKNQAGSLALEYGGGNVVVCS